MNDIFLHCVKDTPGGPERLFLCRDDMFAQYVSATSGIYIRRLHPLVPDILPQHSALMNALVSDFTRYFPDCGITTDGDVMFIPAQETRVPYWIGSMILRESMRAGHPTDIATVLAFLTHIAPNYYVYKKYLRYWRDVVENDARVYGKHVRGHLVTHIDKIEAAAARF